MFDYGAKTVSELKNWSSRPRPAFHLLEGQHVNVVRYDRESHAEDLWQAFGEEATNALLFHFGWPHMKSWQDLADILDGYNASGEFITCVFTDKTNGEALGMASYMSMVPEHGVIETGSIAHGKHFQRSRAATEGHYLMARHIFDELGYRRYEWKLNDPNEASHNAARRFGFTFEGVFRQHQVKPYGNRDTAWYSMLDGEWPRCKAAFEAWLSEANFDANGKQKERLEDIRARLIKS